MSKFALLATWLHCAFVKLQEEYLITQDKIPADRDIILSDSLVSCNIIITVHVC